MKTQAAISIAVLALLVFPATVSWAQTSIGEVGVTTRALETLSETSGGPPASTVGRVRQDLAGQSGVAPAPAGQPSAPQAPVGAPEAIPAGPPPGQVAEGAAGTTELKPPESQPGEEGVPFSLTAASQFANEAVAHLRALRFNEAVEAYRQAKELEPRYEDAYNKAVALKNSIDQGNINQVKNEKVRPNMDLTWRQFLGWERESQAQLLGYQFAPGLGPYPPGFFEGQYPGAAGPYGPGPFDAKGR